MGGGVEGVDGVGGADLHLRENGHAGVHLADHLAEGAEDVGTERRRGGRDAVGAGGMEVAGVVLVLDGERGVGEDFDELLAGLLLGVAGEDAAVDVALGELREGVGSLAGGEHRRDAGGAEDGVVARDGREARDGGCVKRGVEHGVHVGGELAGLERGHLRKIRAADGVQLDWERILLEPAEAVGELVDGVVARGQRTVAAGVLGGDLEVAVELFCRFDGHDDGLGVLGVDAAGVGVDGDHAVDGLDQVGAMGEEPVDAVGFAALFVGGEGENEVAGGDEALALETDEVGDQDGIVVLHVLGAAAVEVAVALDQLEGICVPLGLGRFDDVEMADDEERREGTAGSAAIMDDKVHLARVGTGEDKVGGRKAGVEEALAHGLSGGGDAANGIGGVNLDELLEDVVGELPGGGIERLLGGQMRAEGRDGERGGQKGGGKRRSTIHVHGVLCGG